MRKVICLSIFAGVLALASCSKKTPEPTPTPTPTPVPKAKVMYMNFGTGLGNLYIKVNDSALSTAASIAYLASTGYVDVTVGTSIKSSFYQVSGNSLLLDTTMALVANANYTIVMGGTAAPASPATLVAVTDDLTAPAAGKAKVRVINLSTNNYSESLYVDTAAVISGINYKAVSSFTEVPAGNYAITVFDPAHPTLQKQVTQNYASGKIYTFVLAGKYVSATDNTLTLTAIANN